MNLADAKYLISSPSVDVCPPPDRPEIAFFGRSNVGKSSLINMLTAERRLAKTSSSPGKTQLINHFEVRLNRSAGSKGKKGDPWYLVDLPGYGFAKVAQRSRRRWEQMIEGYIRKRPNLVQLFLLIDSRLSPQKIDLEFINKLGKWGTPFALVFTKADKNKRQRTEENVNSFMEALAANWEQPPVFFVSSAVTEEGKTELLDHIGKLPPPKN